jgi:bla regulator protein BlaR1
VETLYRAGLSNAVSATVLALVVACLGRVLGRRPAVLHCLWMLVLLKLVTPSIYEVPVPWPESSSAAEESASALDVVLLERVREMVGPDNPDDVVDDQLACSAGLFGEGNANSARSWLGELSSIDWMRLASVIWIAGAVTTLVVSIGRIRRFRLLLRDARPADDEIQEWVDELAASLGVDCPPSVWWIDGKLSPMVWSLGWRPRLILPTELWKGLDDHQRSTLIIHELAHLRRGDHHLRLFELLVTALYWWHPVLWWARQALRDVEEQCCDAWVVWAAPDAARSYAETLLETLDFLNQSDLAEPLLASGFGKVQHLRKRLTMIMSGTTPRMLGIWGTLGSLGLAVVLLPVNATWAQTPEEKQEIRVIVKTDDDAAVSNDTVTAVVAPVELTEAVTAIEPAKKEQFSFVFKTDDSASVIAAGSLDEAVKKLHEQIEQIAKKSPQSDKDKTRQKALESALKELKGAIGKIKQSDVVGDNVNSQKNVRRVVVRNVAEGKKIGPEAKAEIGKALDKVKQLAQELQSKQKELREAQRNLSQLQGKIMAKTFIIKDGKLGEANSLNLAPLKPMGQMGGMGVMTPSNAIERRVTVRRDADSGEKRLENLEKKLEKLLDEVSALKKERAK